MADTQTPPAQPRVSRYRSKRQAAQQEYDREQSPALPVVPSTDSPAPEDGVTRTRSRYHRRPATARDQDRIDARPSTRQRQTGATEPHENPLQSNPRDVSYSPAPRHRGEHASPPAHTGAPDLRRLNSGDGDSGAESDSRNRMHGRPSARSRDNSLPMSPQAGNNERPPMPPSQPSGELFPPLKMPEKAPDVKVDGPPQSGHIRATKSVTMLDQFSDEEERGGCFGFFKRKKSEPDPQTAMTSKEARQKSVEDDNIRPGGGGRVPGTDAPISAVNAGDRRVRVHCKKSKITLPVTPETTAIDLIKSASTIMSERIDAKSAVLLEEFHSVGVVRPIRRYEKIRDVMNSWANDTSNVLLIADPGTGNIEPELTAAGVPGLQPQLDKLLLYCSERPGKWDKRYITLKQDGQLVLQKDPEKDRDSTNICHMSDFDIYRPTPEKLRKKIKPPKKICFAVKSQQKSSMFESSNNFVHFFCTNSHGAGDDFYNTVQAWRSWYLVNVMGEGHKPKPAKPAAARPSMEHTRSNSMSQGHKQQDSLESHYQLGTFRPMFENGNGNVEDRPNTSRSHSGGFTKGANQFDPNISPERRASRRRQQIQHPPLALRSGAQLGEDEPLGNLARRTSVNRRPSTSNKALDDQFASNTLLGRSYSKRQRDIPENSTPSHQPFTPNPNHLNTSDNSLTSLPRRHASTRSKPSHKPTSSSDLRRTATTSSPRQSPHNLTLRPPTATTLETHPTPLGRTPSNRLPPRKPLVDLTPTSYEPPQHSKANKGHGHVPDKIGPGGLIDAATSPEDPLGIPAAVDWRTAHSPNRATGGLQQSASARRRNYSPYAQAQGTGEPAATAGAGAGGGLVDQAALGWGGGSVGRGRERDVRKGAGPMVDLREEETFAKGSLLARAEGGGGR
ncbi:hypothetical protein MBLNU230_g0620t1 [Neophaeotheca triangularis]